MLSAIDTASYVIADRLEPPYGEASELGQLSARCDVPWADMAFPAPGDSVRPSGRSAISARPMALAAGWVWTEPAATATLRGPSSSSTSAYRRR